MFFGNIAAASDYIGLQYGTKMLSFHPAQPATMYCTDVDELTWEYCNSRFTALPAGMGSTAVLGIPDLVAMVKGKPLATSVLLQLVNSNQGYRAWTVEIGRAHV